MSHEQIREQVVRALGNIAPEIDAARIDPRANLREALDLDSMDFLSFVTRLHDELHVDVPEADYSKVQTLDDCVSYLAARLEAGPAPRVERSQP